MWELLAGVTFLKTRVPKRMIKPWVLRINLAEAAGLGIAIPDRFARGLEVAEAPHIETGGQGG
jgi:hypothetical protein